jgi:hypothetical protein
MDEAPPCALGVDKFVMTNNLHWFPAPEDR